MKVDANSVESYLAALPEQRRAALQAVRKVILRRLPKGYVEMYQYGMLSYGIPLERYPTTYNGQPLVVASLGAQKNHLAVYLMCIYGDQKLRSWFEAEYRRRGKKLDAGKSCVRFKSLHDLPLELVGEAISRVSVEDLIRMHELAHGKAKSSKPSAKPRKRH
jgi:hypothetical protein